MSADERETVLHARFTESKYYHKVAATGVYGGASPQGEIICNFFVEEQSIPESVEVRIDKETGVASETSDKNVRRVTVREIQVAVVLRPDIAKAVGEWLIQRANEVLTLLPGTTGA